MKSREFHASDDDLQVSRRSAKILVKLSQTSSQKLS